MSMTATNTIPLSGCAPVPLAHYLKALGILRLVAEDKEHGDPQAQGFWKNDSFYLSTKLNEQELVEFFLNYYQPTPILSPWNGGSGFYFQEEKLKEKDLEGKKIKTGKRTQHTAATRVVQKILDSKLDRLERFRQTIRITKELIESKGFIEAPDGSQKDDLLIQLRARWPDQAVQWLDCVAVLTNKVNSESATGLSPAYTTLLGSGANDGNADFTSNFMQRLNALLCGDSDDFAGDSNRWLRGALFAENVSGSRIIGALAGQYSPGTAGGMNSDAGFKSKTSINPWDYVLLIEGALLFAATAMRQNELLNDGSISYPFCVSASGVGYASAAFNDELADKSNTEEMWLPIWDKPCTNSEIAAIFGEGRAQIGSRRAGSGIDFIRAIVGLGVDRGISHFQRVGFFVRNGKSVFATPLDRVAVSRNARADLLSEVDAWLVNFRRKTGPLAKPEAPASVRRALNELESKIIALCRQNNAAQLQAVLIALGRCERAIARSLRWAKGLDEKPPKVRVSPLHNLSPRWLIEAQTETAEFRLAMALASTWGRYGDKVMVLRQHLEPVETKGRGWLDWAENPSNDVLWHEGDFIDVLNAIFARRVMKASQSDTQGFPDQSPCPARLSDLADFIEGRTNDDLIADLVWGLSLIDWSKYEPPPPDHGEEEPISPSSLYALLRLCFRDKHKDLETVPVVGAIHRRAAQDEGSRATDLAIRRLRASGYPPAIKGLRITGETVRRTAAALLFPIAFKDFSCLQKTIVRPSQENT